MAEGIGTSSSDLDVYILTERILEVKLFGSIITFQCGSAVIDLERWSLLYVEELVARLEDSAFARSQNCRDTLNFSASERNFLHRLQIGQPLTEAAAFSRLHDRVDPVTLSRLNFELAILRVGTLQLDLIGFLDAGDTQSALFLSQTLLGCVVDALLATMGNTNPGEKWRLRKLQMHEIDWDEDFPGGRLEPSTADFFFTLHTPKSLDPEDLKDHACQCVRLANRIIP